MKKSKKPAAQEAASTVVTIEDTGKFEYIVVNIICLFAFLAFGYIAIMGFFQTSVIDSQNYASEVILYDTDNLALNLLFTALFVALVFYLRRFYDFFAKVNIKVLEIVIGVYAFLLGLIWILSVTSVPAADSYNIYEAASWAAKGNYNAFRDFTEFYNKDFYAGYSYFNFYPFQLGFVFFSELVYRIFGTGSSMPVQVLNVIALGFAYVGIAKITGLIFKRKSIEFIAILMLGGCIQPILFCTFVYGNIIGMGMGVWACFFLIKYFQGAGWKTLIPCGVLLVVSTIVKYNNMIYLAAFVIMLVIHTVKHKKWQSVAFALAIVVGTLGSSSLIVMSYEQRADTVFADGVSQVLYLDMGLQESGRAPGWYTRKGLDTYLNNGFDSSRANAQGWEDIGQRLDDFGSNLNYTFDFFGKKILSQWNEPTFESIWVSKVKSHERDMWPLGTAVYDKSLGQFLELHFAFYMQIIYLLFALGIYMLFVNKKSNIQTVLFPLIIMGGFGYHLLFEAKSQYIVTYIPLLIPTAAYALNNIMFGRYEKLKAIVAKIKNIPQKSA